MIAFLTGQQWPLLDCKVELHSLVGRADLNGSVGVVVLVDEKSGRYGVKLDGGESIKLLPKNVARLD